MKLDKLSKTLVGKLAVTLLGIFLLVAGYHLLVVGLVSCWLTYQLLCIWLPGSQLDSRLLRIVVSIIIYGLILQFSSTVVWLISKDFPLDRTPYLSLAFLAANYVLVKNKLKSSEKKSVPLVIYSDLIAVAIALFFSLLLFVGPIRNSLTHLGTIDYRSVAVDMLNTSLDDSSHLSRVNDRLQLNRGVIYGSNEVDYVVHKNTVNTYPVGWHAFNALLIRMLYPEVSVGGVSLVFYIVTKILWFSALIYLFVRFIFQVLDHSLSLVNTKIRKNILYAVTSLASLFLAYYMLLELFKEGFYNFIPTVTYLLVIGIILFTETNSAKHKQSIIPIVLLMVGASISWILIAPAFVITVIGYIASSEYAVGWGKKLRTLMNTLAVNSPVIIVALLAFFLQLYLLTTGEARSFSEGVNDPGAITQHGQWYGIFIISGALLFSLRHSKPNKTPGPFYLLVSGLLSCSLLIYVFQMITALKPEYYYTKTLNTALVLLVPIAIIGWVGLFEKLTSKLDVQSHLGIGLILLASLPLVLGLDPVNTSTVEYILGRREFSPSENLKIFNDIEEQSRLDYRQRKSYSFMYMRDNYGYTVVGSNILNSMQHLTTCYFAIHGGLAQSNAKVLDSAYNKCSPDTQLRIYTNDLVDSTRENGPLVIQATQ